MNNDSTLDRNRGDHRRLGGMSGLEVKEGDLLAGRYRIDRYLAQGAMGVVFEALDTELNEHVAIKLLRPELAQSEEVLERFRREIQLARKVTHPNVCRIFDLGFHERANRPRLAFLTMELLKGKTLAERIDEAGRLSPQEALPIIRQVAGALDVAHRAGVVHRDLKSNNIVLVEGTPGSRAVITDFGLSYSLGDDSSVATRLTSTGNVLGTPGYLAPEQLEDGPITPRTDLYALGIVIFEMLTGELPFRSDKPLATALKRLHDPPPSPRALRPELSAQWERAILVCLSRHPTDRFESGAQLVAALDASGSETASAHGSTTSSGGIRAPWTSRLGITLVVLLAFSAGWWWLSHRPLPGKAASHPANQRPSVAVIGFKNLSQNARFTWLSTAISEMLATDLATGGQLRTIPGESVERARLELSLPRRQESDSFAPDTLKHWRSLLATDYVVVGSFLALGGPTPQLRLDLRLQSTASARTLLSRSITGSQSDLLTLVTQAGDTLRSVLGAPPLDKLQIASLRTSQPADPKGTKLYAQGLARLRHFDALGARDLFAKVVEAQPGFALGHSALAEAWYRLGYDRKARAESDLALRAARGLPRQAALEIQARDRAMRDDWEGAAKLFAILAGYFPDDLDYALQRIEARAHAGHADSALAAARDLAGSATKPTQAARIALAEARAASFADDYHREWSAARRAIDNATKIGMRFLLAQALLVRATAANRLGKRDDALHAAAEADDLFRAFGDRNGMAKALFTTATIEQGSSQPDAAEASFRKALIEFQAIGNRRMTGAVLNAWGVLELNRSDLDAALGRFRQARQIFVEIQAPQALLKALGNLGIVYSIRGDVGEAQATFVRSLGLARSLGNEFGEAAALTNLAIVASDRGDNGIALKRYRQALQIFTGLGDRSNQATVLLDLGVLEWDRGELAAAYQDLDKARAIYNVLHDASSVATALNNLAEVRFDQGELSEAARMLLEAATAQRELGEKLPAAKSDALRARALLAAGQVAQALPLATRAAAALSKGSSPDDQALASTILARAMAASGRWKSAAAAIDRAAHLASKRANPEIALYVDITRAEFMARKGKTTDARELFESSLADAKRSQLKRLELAARLGLTRLAVETNPSRRAAENLERLADEASSLGYGLLAREARESSPQAHPKG